MKQEIVNMEFDYVIKRNGKNEKMSLDKIEMRISNLCDGLNVNLSRITRDVASRVYNKMKTYEIDELSAQICASICTEHPDYGTLASRIIISNHHKNTSPSFTEVIRNLYENKNIHGKHSPLVSIQLFDTVMKNCEKLNSSIHYERDYFFDYFGFKTLEKSYLLRLMNNNDKNNNNRNIKILERPQHMFMRVSLGIHGDNIKDALETYNLMSCKYFIHATPTLFNAGTPRPQLSSCFLVAMKEDSIDGIYSTLRNCALISKWAGGIGVHIHNIRAKNTVINGTNGISNGIVPMLRVFNDTARYVDQGGGKRKGSIAIYLEPWHADIEDFLLLKKNHGHQEERAHDLFYALWVCDLFMSRIEDDGQWSLFCPHECPGLSDCYGYDFEKLYTKYEREGKATKTIPAQQLWKQVLERQIETGLPYICYKDACNKKSNQKNLGTIKSSNLCTEIIEYSDSEETAVCNLASIGLPKYVIKKENGEFDFDWDKLLEVSRVITKNLNKIIDVNFYPIPEAERSNRRHRPIGIGVQGLADVFVMMRMSFDSLEAKELNSRIFETIYYGALLESCQISKDRAELWNSPEGHDDNDFTKEEITRNMNLKGKEMNLAGTYSSFIGSPLNNGLFQFDLWEAKPEKLHYDWEELRTLIGKYGTRNSLLLAPMPTASTSQILGNNETIEPFTSNIYLRRTIAGEFVVVNKHLIRECVEKNIWNVDIKNKIIADKGSVQNVNEMSDEMKQIYKTTWEISHKVCIDLAADRGLFIDQSQSLNAHIKDLNYSKLNSMHFYTWKKGLKTGMYYLRSMGIAQAQQFTIEPELKPDTNNPVIGKHIQSALEIEQFKREEEIKQVGLVCSRDNPDCEACSA